MMNEMYFVRQAEPGDAEPIHCLLKTIAELHRQGRGDLFSDFESKYSRYELAQRLAVKNNGIFVAECCGEVAGYVFCDILTHEDQPHLKNIKTLYIDDLCVSEMHRRKGIAAALMEKAKSFGRECGCYDMELNVWEFNKNAIAFYESIGMTTRKRYMEFVL